MHCHQSEETTFDRSPEEIFDSLNSARRQLAKSVISDPLDARAKVEAFLGDLDKAGSPPGFAPPGEWIRCLDDALFVATTARAIDSLATARARAPRLIEVREGVMTWPQFLIQNRHPETIAILKGEPDEAGQTLLTSSLSGSGILISSDIVLTASHVVSCHKPEELRVSTGDGIGFGDGKAEDLRVLCRKSFHECQDDESHDDIAVLRIQPSTMSSIRLAEPADFTPDANWRIVGFGLDPADPPGKNSGLKQFSPDNILSISFCNRDTPTSLGCEVGKEILIYDFTDPSSLGVDACPGDSGGPLLVNSGEGWRLVAIGSRNLGEECGMGSIYTGLAQHFEWIRDAIQELGGEMPPQLVEV